MQRKVGEFWTRKFYKEVSVVRESRFLHSVFDLFDTSKYYFYHQKVDW